MSNDNVVDIHANKAVDVYFNFRSPYCYLASKNMFSIFDEYQVELLWRPFAGWSGRSSPERVKTKIRLVRQDVARSCRKMGIPFSPPPIETDPTLAGAISFAAEKKGLLKPYIIEVMRKEWAEGQNIGEISVLHEVAEQISLPRKLLEEASRSEVNLARMDDHWQEAQSKGVIGVPSFTIDDQVFWGNDRIDSLKEYLHEMRLRKI